MQIKNQKHSNQLFPKLAFVLPEEKSSIAHATVDNGDFYIILT